MLYAFSALIGVAVVLFFALCGNSGSSQSESLTPPVEVLVPQPVPLFSQTIYVRGSSHQSAVTKKNRQRIYKELQQCGLLVPGQQLRLVHEEGNRFDEDAILVVLTFEGALVDVGYLPASMSSIVRRTGFQDGHTFVVSVLAIEQDRYQPQNQVILISLDRYGKNDRHPDASDISPFKFPKSLTFEESAYLAIKHSTPSPRMPHVQRPSAPRSRQMVFPA